MLALNFDITIGAYRLTAVDSVTIKKSVESLSDTATIVLPGSVINSAIEVENKIAVGNEVSISLGYNNDLKVEFEGFLKTIQTDNAAITLECEDALYLFTKEVADKEYKNISAKILLEKITQQIDPSFSVSCDYDFSYDKFVVKDATAYDVLKKVQEETRANIYLNSSTLHCHPQYSEIANLQPVIYDFSVNIEKSDLKYKKADERKYFVEVEGIAANGTRTTVSFGKTGGEKRSIKVYGVTDEASLLKRAQEELSLVVYTGFEGNFTSWLIPYCEPAFAITLRDNQYPHKNGNYYVIATETSFSSSGGIRKITIGKKIL